MSNIIHEIHAQKPVVRFALFAASSIAVVSMIGYVWFSDFQQTAYLALHTNPEQQAAFLAQREANKPQALALISGALGSMTAAIGDVFGFDRSDGFDKTSGTDNTREAVYTLPLAK